MSLQQTTQLFLTWGGPPLIGALIGYLTNEVAIKMLFRPLKPWRVFGIRVPLTPGVIPSKRHQLAENIGEMVGGKLLTAQDIGEAMSSERFQNHLRRIAEEKMSALLQADTGPLLNLVPQPFRVHVKIGLRTLKHRVRQGVLAQLGSPVLMNAAGGILADWLRSAGGRRLEELLHAEDRAGLYAALESLSMELLTAPGTAERLGGQLEKSLAEAAVAGRTVGSLLPDELRELLCSLAAEHAPEVLAQAAAIMAEPPMRERVAQAVRGGVDHFIDNLGPMAAMAKGFINMASLDGVIRTWLAEREGDLAAWLQQPALRSRTAQALRDQAEAFFAAPLAELLAKIGEERLRYLCQQTAARLVAALADRSLRQTVSALLREQIEEQLDHGQIFLADLSGRLLPDTSRRRLHRAALGEVRSLADSEPVRRLVSKLINSMIDQLAARPASVLRELLPADLRGSLVNFLVLNANRLLIREAPGLTESLRIRELVRSKVDSLDLLRLERLLLSIMEEQFKYINLFGALLGFLIGLLNLALLRFM
jgi:uncharacterized membrane protein YheB (UPF0754 family)